LEAATKAEPYKSAVCSEYPTYIIMSIIITIIIIIITITLSLSSSSSSSSASSSLSSSSLSSSSSISSLSPSSLSSSSLSSSSLSSSLSSPSLYHYHHHHHSILSSSPDGTLETAAPIRKDPTVKAAIVSEDMVGRSYEQLLFLVNRHIGIADLIQLTPITLREEQVKR
jgi:hypothetical protein